MTVLEGERVTLRPLEAADFERVRELSSAPEVVEWWGPPADGFPARDEPEATRFVIVAGGDAVGMIQYGEEPEHDYRHAWIDIFVAAGHQRRGYGRDALTRLVRHLVEDRGHHRVTIDPALENLPAVGCYAGAGFAPVGVLRRAWLDPTLERWRDVLLMEIVVEPGAPGG